MIALTRANTKQSIWINPNNILYFHRDDKGAEIGLIGCDITVAETPEEIEQKINNLLYHKE